MKKRLGALALAGLVAQAGTAGAATINLTETFASGATFTGVLTFSDNYDQFQGVNGTLTGGGHGTITFDWAWWLGTGQPSIAQDDDGNPATYEDWMMDGSPPDDWANIIGLSWSAPGGKFQLALVPDTDVYHAGFDAFDPVVSYSVSGVPEADSVAMMLAGLAALGVLARRQRRS